MRFVHRPFRITKGMIIGTFLVTLGLCLLTWVGLVALPSTVGHPEDFSAVLTILPAPTYTPTPIPVAAVTPTASELPNGQGIVIGAYVQITGTGGQGLRLRAAPGLDAALLFLGYDAEVYQVRDGPRQADGYTWWYLVAPYDEQRAGWAAADYLTLVAPPQP
ncbi:MAG: SH3 domain-containing protein [Anaerolineales bacterium]